MIYPYGNDYIKYLNDEGSNGITYEQWKNKKVSHTLTSAVNAEMVKTAINLVRSANIKLL